MKRLSLLGLALFQLACAPDFGGLGGEFQPAFHVLQLLLRH